MNRRECLAALSTGLIASGVEVEGAVEVKIIDAEPEPLLLVVRTEGRLSMEARACIRESLERAFGDRPHPPIVVCDCGMSIEAVVDPRRKP